jgi:hypothetical protein
MQTPPFYPDLINVGFVICLDATIDLMAKNAVKQLFDLGFLLLVIIKANIFIDT